MDATDLHLAVTLADTAASTREAVTTLRQRFPALRVSAVDSLDMRGETPAARCRSHTFWMGATDGHCWRITAEPAEATALFIAEGGAA